MSQLSRERIHSSNRALLPRHLAQVSPRWEHSSMPWLCLLSVVIVSVVVVVVAVA